ncbi:MAG: SufS family cysteine desulfurase [Acidobacteria bacterium]|nr:SufS family cysteine desulfurase [Acidobacteriota bacterium]
MENKTFTEEEIGLIRSDFPILSRKINGHPLIYLDNAATTQKPKCVIEKMADFSKTSNANIHRAVHTLSYEATVAYEKAHKSVAKFIGAKSWREVVFVRNATEALNLVAHSFGEKYLKPSDEVVLTIMEHHSNIVPWLMLRDKVGIKLKFIMTNEDGTLNLDEAEKVITKKTKLVGAIFASNVLGVVNDIAKLRDLSRSVNAKLLIDGAQSLPHIPTNVSEIDCDFFVASAHKMAGPTGIGFLYAKREILEEMPPFLTGGDMIQSVTLEGATWNELPFKFEAGTPAFTEAVGFEEAIKYLSNISMEKIFNYEKELEKFISEELKKMNFLDVYGHKSGEHLALFSFNIKNVHPHDAASFLDRYGIAVRSGSHCAQPLMKQLNIDNTLRASFYFYNTKEEAEKLFLALQEINRFFNK